MDNATLGLVFAGGAQILTLGLGGLIAFQRLNKQIKETRKDAADARKHQSKTQAREWVRQTYLVECIHPLLDWLYTETLINSLGRHIGGEGDHQREIDEHHMDLRRMGLDVSNPIPKHAISRLARLTPDSDFAFVFSNLSRIEMPQAVTRRKKIEEAYDLAIRALINVQTILTNHIPDEILDGSCTRVTQEVFFECETKLREILKGQGYIE